MARGILVLLLAILSASPVLRADSITTNQLGQGVVYQHFVYTNLYSSKQVVYLVDVNLNDPAVSLKLPYLTGGATRTVQAHAATVASAVAAINGQFFLTNGSGCYLKVSGSVVNLTATANYDQQAITDNGLKLSSSIFIALRPGNVNAWSNLVVSNIIACGPDLVANGVRITNYNTNDTFITGRNPRTCVGWTYDNHLLLMVVDGRSSAAAGMTIPELRDELFTMGAIRNGFNFDGGGSSTMVCNSNVVNVPSDGVARAVANAVVIAAPPPAIPAAPAGLVAVVASNQVSLTWKLSSGAMTYTVKRSLASGGSYSTIDSPTSTNYVDTNLAFGTTYYYEVSAVNLVGQSSNSAPVSATTPSLAPVPTGLVATATTNHIELTWSASAGATSYHVERSIGTNNSYVIVGNILVTNFFDGSVIAGMIYNYEVAAVNGVGVSAPSTAVAATTAAVSPLITFSAPPGFFSMACPSESNHFYQLQATGDLKSDRWTNLGPQVSGTGSNLVFIQPQNGTISFFRIATQ